MIYRYTFLVLFCLSVGFCSAQESMMGDVSYPLLEKLIATAKANYPKMKAYDHAIRISELNVKKAKLDWLNLVSFIYLINPAAAGASAVGGFQTGVSVSIGSILQKPGEVKVAKEELNVTNLGKDEYTLSIEAQVQQRYFQYVVALTSLNWKNKDVQTMESTVKDVKYKFEKGELPFEEYNRALTAYSGGVQGRIQAEGNYLIAKSNLEELIGAKLETIK
ncbi:MAG: TolC family protein [Flavipsychrobacter sp.]|nr:TolC family protein [Flavipsychrobacter sp.]